MPQRYITETSVPHTIYRLNLARNQQMMIALMMLYDFILIFVSERLHASLYGFPGKSFGCGTVPTRTWVQSKHRHRGVCVCVVLGQFCFAENFFNDLHLPTCDW